MKRYLLATMFTGLAACSGGTTTTDGGTANTPDVTSATGAITQYVVNKLLVPMQRKDYSIDLNGDGHPDNQLGNIIGTLASNMLDTQGGIDKSINDGSVILLMSFQTASQTQSDNAGLTMYLGAKAPNPDFGGMGMFTVDASQKATTLFGRINGGKFLSNNPVTTTHPVTVQIKLPLIAGADALTLNVNGAHIQFNTGSGLMNGQIHGSIKKADIDNGIIPAVAMLLTKKVAADCKGGGGSDGGAPAPDGGAGVCSSSAKQILSIFDTGNCTNPDGTKAVAGDGKIDICEVSTNSIIMNVLAPDVQIYDASGNYAPNKANTTKDSLSLGLGFTAVGAKFTAP